MTPQSPLVSVIIPTHRRPEWLRRALASALAQTYPAIDIHVVENGVRAGAQQVVEEFARASRPIQYHYVEEGNVCLARNHGISRSHAPYVAFLDDDDEWLPGKLALQLQALEADRRLGWIACRAWRVLASGEVQLTEQPFYRGEPTLAALVSEWCFIWTPSCVVVRRDGFSRAGAFDRQWPHCADYDLYLRLARHFPFTMLEEPLVRYHQHGANMSGDPDRVWLESMAILRRVRPSATHGLTRSMIDVAIRQYPQWFYSFGLHLQEHGRPLHAARCLATALRCDPAVGLRASWGRERPAWRRLAQPYAAMLRCLAAAPRKPPIDAAPPSAPPTMACVSERS